MFVDNLKRFHANVTRRRACLAIFTSRRKTGTYGAKRGASLPPTRLAAIVDRSVSARGQIAIHG
jgi:hypothetical protein